MNILKSHVYGSFNVNNSQNIPGSFEEIFLEYYIPIRKNKNSASAVLGGGGGLMHGKVCWLYAIINTGENNGQTGCFRIGSVLPTFIVHFFNLL